MKIPSSQVYVTLISTLRELFEGSEEAPELAVVATVATLIPTIRIRLN